jgi:predicted Zn-dependent protease
LLGSDPAAAAAEAEKILADDPDQPMALLFRGIAQRLGGQGRAAIETLQQLCERWPDAPAAHLQLGLALRECAERERAVAALRRTVEIRPDFADGWLALADLSTAMGNKPEAHAAFAAYVRNWSQVPQLQQAVAAIQASRFVDAEAQLRRQLHLQPNDVVALCLMADLAARHAKLDDAEILLKSCIDLAPSYAEARQNYAVTLMRQDKPAAALIHVDLLLQAEPTNPAYHALRASILMQLGDYAQALEIQRRLLDVQPGRPRTWISYGHALRAVGEMDQCIAAYRKAGDLAPQLGEPYWNLANLKRYSFSAAEIAAMTGRIAESGLPDEERIYFHFALGKAHEDLSDHATSFAHYAEGNRLRRRSIDHDPRYMSEHVRRTKQLMTASFFAGRAGWGADDTGPIFIVGLPRSGSTLAEQILASHSLVEGTRELYDMIGIAKFLNGNAVAETGGRYPEVLEELTRDACAELGRRYLDQTRVVRRTDRPYFIDKMPNNFAHAGLIHLLLPNARIIDVRRHPLACGWSVYKHLFARGQSFSYDLGEIGRYYRDYVELMAHFDGVLPGRIHRVHYEKMVLDTVNEVRRLLDHCGLPFEPGCLAFHETRRAVSTPSSEQVRTPVYRDALQQWRNFESWLEPLRAEMNELVESYPPDV